MPFNHTRSCHFTHHAYTATAPAAAAVESLILPVWGRSRATERDCPSPRPSPASTTVTSVFSSPPQLRPRKRGTRKKESKKKKSPHQHSSHNPPWRASDHLFPPSRVAPPPLNAPFNSPLHGACSAAVQSRPHKISALTLPPLFHQKTPFSRSFCSFLHCKSTISAVVLLSVPSSALSTVAVAVAAVACVHADIRHDHRCEGHARPWRVHHR